MELTEQLIDGLREIPNGTVYGSLDASRQAVTVSFNVCGLEPSEVGLRLDQECAILWRVGLHCSPAAHNTMGTFPMGTVRFGLAGLNSAQDVHAAVGAVRRLAREGHGRS